VAPLTFVVARSGIAIEVAVLPTRRRLVSAQASAEAELVVVAGAQAVRIERVDEPILVVVSAISALILFATTRSLLACRRARFGNGAGRGDARDAPERKRAPRAATSGTERVIATDLDGLAATVHQQQRERSRGTPNYEVRPAPVR
jgi:hypothetical protein